MHILVSYIAQNLNLKENFNVCNFFGIPVKMESFTSLYTVLYHKIILLLSTTHPVPSARKDFQI